MVDAESAAAVAAHEALGQRYAARKPLGRGGAGGQGARSLPKLRNPATMS